MEEEQKLRMINEIKRIERELYLKRSQLAAAEAMKHEGSVCQGLDSEEWKKVFSRLIGAIGHHSTGGDSVEDIKRERQR